MRKVKYIRDRKWNAPGYYSFTSGKVYDLISYIPNIDKYSDRMEVLNEFGELENVRVYSYAGNMEFIDVTAKLRNVVIDSILM